MSNRNAALLAAAREDFATFTTLTFEAFYGRELEMNWHILAMCHKLERAAKGIKTRLIFNLPPRHLKSFVTSVAFPLWLLGRKPSAQVMVVSYGDSLVEELGELRLKIAKNPIYRAIFPDLKSNFRTQSIRRLRTAGGGKIEGLSLGGPITGKGCDYLIIDDPIKAEDGLNETARNSAFQVFKNTLLTRLNNRKSGVIILAMQRLHEDDLTGQVLPLYEWDVLKVSAIATRTEIYRLKDGRHRRLMGEPIQPSRADAAQCAIDRRALGSRMFEAQFQQNPLPIEGELIKLAWFGRYKHGPALGDFDWIALSVDSARSLEKGADYSVISVWGCLNKKYYLLYVHRDRCIVPELRRRICKLQKRWSADFILIEMDGVGKAVYDELRERKVSGLKARKVRTNKVRRFAAIEGALERGDVILPEDAPWLAAFERELLGFPHVAHDDQVDTMTQLVYWALDRRASEPRKTAAQAIKPSRPISSSDESGRGRAYARSREQMPSARSALGFSARVLAERSRLMPSDW